MRLFPTKRVWIRIGIGLAILVALVLIANGFMIWRTDRRLQARIDAIRSAGDPATIADLAPDPIPDDQNAAYYLKQIAPRLDQFSMEYSQFLYKTPLGKAYDAALGRDEYGSIEQLDGMRQILDRYPDIDAGLAAAAACDQYASLLDFNVDHQKFLQSILDHRATQFRTLAKFTMWRMEVLAGEGRADEAVQLGTLLLKVAQLHENEPLLINNILSVAIRGITSHAIYDSLNLGAVSLGTLTELDHQLALSDQNQGLVRVLKTEQAFSISVISDGGFAQSGSLNSVTMKLLGWPVKSIFVDSLGVFDDLAPLVGKQWFEIRDRFGPDGKPNAPEDGTVGELAMPALLWGINAHNRSLSDIRSIRIASALARYRHEHGRDASDLDQLQLPKEVTLDPFSGAPLKLKKTNDGWLIYTVMENGIDDGGEFEDQKDRGFTPRKQSK